MHYVYILKLSNSDFYIGYSNQLKVRIHEHQTGQVAATHLLLPLQLVTYIAFSTKYKALKYEKYLKTRSGFAFRNRHLV